MYYNLSLIHIYISSGTWSLMGTELKEADCGTEAMQHNFTNEGGYNRKYRFLKNIMEMCIRDRL